MILVTGGTGLLGSHLLVELTNRGKKVRALVRDYNQTAHVKKLFSLLPGTSELQYSLIEWVEGDITDITSIDQALVGVDEVYHCAALVSFYSGDNALMMKINAAGTANIVNACLKHNIRKLLHVSSVAALGIPETGDIIDEKALWKPSGKNSGYAISKYSAEREVWRGIAEGLNAVIVNPSVILGVSFKSASSNQVFQNLNRLHQFYTGGSNSYIDVRDVATIMILLMESDINAQKFLLTNENLSFREFISTGTDILGKKPPYIPLNRALLSLLWRLNYVYSWIARTKPLFTPEIVRPLSRKQKYSSAKFLESFSYTFIPVKQSLADGFRMLGFSVEKTNR